MKTILVSALKGGVGKTTVTANLGLALRRASFTVGLLDLDYRNPNLPDLLNQRPLALARGKGDILIPPEAEDGVFVFSMGFIWPAGKSVLVEDADASEDVAHLLSENVIAWPPLDFLLLDTPPSTSGITKVAMGSLKRGQSGALLVTHPSRLSLGASLRSLDLFREKQVPVYGIVSNQGKDEEGRNRYDLTDEDVEDLARRHYLPLFQAIPHTAHLSTHFDRLAALIVKTLPTLLEKEAEVGGEAWKKLLKLLRSLRS